MPGYNVGEGAIIAHRAGGELVAVLRRVVAHRVRCPECGHVQRLPADWFRSNCRPFCDCRAHRGWSHCVQTVYVGPVALRREILALN